ncbi:uncharacterized protein LOC128558041 [Mercenaria mercenaria]|uniref:uncharacterized protein LOC128558041 n=1 Tax=Mercenaria mercenaria TaxID=6596 RepID=UPI00234E8F40|nr:uncharacterized protein LOC128558041 [Mercenaria mercenaria]
MYNLFFIKVSMMICSIFFSGYFAFFKLGATENAVKHDGENRHEVFVVADKESDANEFELDREADDDRPKALEYWEHFINTNNFTAIGEIYDNCGEKISFEIFPFLETLIYSELVGGRFFLEVKYNGKDLYSNNWELCTLDEDYDDRIVYCPFYPGEYSFVKDKSLYTYQRWDRFESKAWITDQEDRTIVCGYSDFTL